MITNGSPELPDQPASQANRPAQRGRARTKVGDWAGVRQARRATEWGKQRHADSSAEYLWGRLNTLDFINQGMLFAATLLLCALPFLVVVTALAGRSAATGIGRRMGLNAQASAHFSHLFATPGQRRPAVIGTMGMVFFVLGGIAVVVGSTVGLVAIYYLLPPDQFSPWVAVIILVAGLVLLVGLIAVQVRPIIAHPYPQVRAVEALATA